MKKTYFPLLGFLLLTMTAPIYAQTVTVVEYRNTALDAYFITGRSTEQALLDANTSFTRSGMSFTATALTAATSAQGKVCRFYVSATSPFVSSHFYGGQSAVSQAYDCQSLIATTPSGFSYEGYDFAALLPTSGACPTGTSTVYRGFHALTLPNNGKTSNHRYSVGSANYATATAAGYVGEGAQFCVTAASTTTTAVASSLKGEVWVDNWFQLYVGNTLTATDSVPITTERSFNSETFNFTATYPFDLNFIIKDYKANDSGLEYIGTPQQQIGDGGFIAQITDTGTGKVVAVSSASWKCKVIQKAPLNPTCVSDQTATSCLFTNGTEPTGWKNTGFDTSTWESATEYTATTVGVKQGYYDITWNSAAKLIWTSDLKLDNTLLCKATVTGK